MDTPLLERGVRGAYRAIPSWSRALARRTHVWSWIVAAALVGGWQGLANANSGISHLLSSPVLVVERLVTIGANGTLWQDTLPTIEETLGGLALGVLVGTIGGIWIASSTGAGRIIDPYLVGFNGLPKVALAPFFVVWFGIGLLSKMLLAVSIVFVVVLFNVREGMESIDHELVDALRSMHARRRDVLRYVIAPSLAPWLLSSVKVGIGLALTGAVVGELAGAASGLGYYITYSLTELDMTGAMAALVVLAALSVIMYDIVLVVERRVLRWRSMSDTRQRHSS